MTKIRALFFSFVVAALIISVLQSLFPKGTFQRMGRFLGGLILLALLIRSVTGAELSFAEWDYEEIHEKLSQQEQDLASQGLRNEMVIIEDKTAAYIAQTARELDLVCTAEVSCEIRSGVPFPSQVTLNIPFHAALSERIRQELAIAPENQHWTESNS